MYTEMSVYIGKLYILARISTIPIAAGDDHILEISREFALSRDPAQPYAIRSIMRSLKDAA
jgi:hypothetical protein